MGQTRLGPGTIGRRAALRSSDGFHQEETHQEDVEAQTAQTPSCGPTQEEVSKLV
jgi:hypothetical protein